MGCILNGNFQRRANFELQLANNARCDADFGDAIAANVVRARQLWPSVGILDERH